MLRGIALNAPIHSKLDFSGLWDLATQLKILSYSKILSELGDIVVRSLKLSDFRKSPYKSFGKIVSKFAKIHEFEVVFNYQELYLQAQAKFLNRITF